MRKKIRTGDQVLVIAGNDKGKVGKVLSFRGEDRVVVEGVNVRKKHMKPRQQNQKGQIVDMECSIHVSNVSLSVDGKPVKLRVRETKEGKRELYYKEGQNQVLYRSVESSKGA